MFEEAEEAMLNSMKVIMNRHNNFEELVKAKLNIAKYNNSFADHSANISFADHSANQKQLDEMQRDLEELLK